ncbi:hypothetical protein [Streptacidiphilus rugosus]|uniref:hypothetical protein n=1 Tax=Streptacidiphilus rugosus TaxID=405783 RepID=UPI00055D353F|nr:hypothetical protein [Streptacidiphilus rugosus]
MADQHPERDERDERRDARAEQGEGGEAACWLDRLCPECGAVPEPPEAATCWRCGAARRPGPSARTGADPDLG